MPVKQESTIHELYAQLLVSIWSVFEWRIYIFLNPISQLFHLLPWKVTVYTNKKWHQIWRIKCDTNSISSRWISVNYKGQYSDFCHNLMIYYIRATKIITFWIKELQFFPGGYCLNFFCTRLSAHKSKNVVVTFYTCWWPLSLWHLIIQHIKTPLPKHQRES
jgi:hypothetical protein